MLQIGLTGSIASGKSTVARVWQRLGAHVIDADELARRAVEPGTSALRRLRRAFGSEVIDAGGRLDREAVRRIVFRDAAARRQLEAIVHPAVARLRARETERLDRAGARIVVNDIPLLFEVGMEDAFDVVVVVDSPVEARLQRLVRDRGIAPEDARRMIEAQMPAGVKRDRADIVIANDGTIDELEKKAARVWKELERRVDASA